MIVFAVLVSICLVATSEEFTVKPKAEPCPGKCEGKPLDISLVIDASASIWPQNFTIGLWFVQNFVDKFNIGPGEVRVSAVTYGDRVYEEDVINFGDYDNEKDLDKAIEALPYRAGRSTETGAAIRYMLDNQLPDARPDVRKVIIVLTDGNSQRQDVTKAEAERALAEGLEVFAIGVGHDVSMQELHNIASDGKHVFVVGTYHMLDDILERLEYETCGVPPVPPCKFDPVDIAFVIDSSQSVGQDNFTTGLEFINQFLGSFEINPSAVRVAAIMFGERVYQESAIPFDAYTTKKTTLDAILGLKWKRGTRTETGQGIDYMVDNFLPKTRPHAARIGIVITDGQSQERGKTAKAAERARSQGVTMFAVGVGELGKTIDEAELKNIAGDSSRVLTAVDYARLNTIKVDLTRITCAGIDENLHGKHSVFD